MQVLLTIPLGLMLQLAVFMILRSAFGVGAKPAALIVGLLALALYVPYAILDWPGADVVALHVAIFSVAAYALALIIGHRDANQGDAQGFHWAPALIVSFFVVLVLFNAVLVVVATRGLPEPVARALLPQREGPGDVSSAFPGVVENDYQKKEALYNAYLEQVERQRARGWTVQKGWVGEARAGEPALFQVVVTDRAGNPVGNARVQGGFLRPSDTRLDQRFELTETDSGTYQVEVSLPAPGVWNLVLEIRRGEELHEVHASTRIDG